VNQRKKRLKTKKEVFLTLKIAVVVAQDRNGNIIAKKAGTGRVKAKEIDVSYRQLHS
jgi:hypothetical protein